MLAPLESPAHADDATAATAIGLAVLQSLGANGGDVVGVSLTRFALVVHGDAGSKPITFRPGHPAFESAIRKLA